MRPAILVKISPGHRRTTNLRQPGGDRGRHVKKAGLGTVARELTQGETKGDNGEPGPFSRPPEDGLHVRRSRGRTPPGPDIS